MGGLQKYKSQQSDQNGWSSLVKGERRIQSRFYTFSWLAQIIEIKTFIGSKELNGIHGIGIRLPSANAII